MTGVFGDWRSGIGLCVRSRPGTSSFTICTRRAVAGVIVNPAARLSSAPGETSSERTGRWLHARGVPVVSVMTIGKLMPAASWPSTRCTWGLIVDGIVACAATFASSSDVAETSRESRLTADCVNRNTATTSRLPPTNSVVLSNCLPCDEPLPMGRAMLPLALSNGGSASGAGFQHLEPTEIRAQRLRHHHRAVGLLVVLEQRRVRARQRHARGVERVRVLHLGAGLPAEAHAHAPRLEIFKIRARAALEPRLRAGRPHLEVVALGGGEAEVAAAEQHDAIRQLERLEDVGDLARELLVLVVARFGRHDLHQLDLVELVHAHHAAR